MQKASGALSMTSKGTNNAQVQQTKAVSLNLDLLQPSVV